MRQTKKWLNLRELWMQFLVLKVFQPLIFSKGQRIFTCINKEATDENFLRRYIQIKIHMSRTTGMCFLSFYAHLHISHQFSAHPDRVLFIRICLEWRHHSRIPVHAHVDTSRKLIFLLAHLIYFLPGLCQQCVIVLVMFSFRFI